MIQTYPRQLRLIVRGRYSDFDSAVSACDLENLSHDSASFALRVEKDGKLYHVSSCGLPSSLSLQQDWKISLEYKKRHNNDDGEIVVCRCSYPYFVLDNFLTCLIDDSGREIACCPNCDRTH